MGNNSRRAGILYLKLDSIIYDAKGNFSYNIGKPKREAIIGADQVHGFKETVQVPFIEGEITDSASLSLSTLVTLDNVTATLELANGKIIVVRNAWFAGDGNVETEEGNIKVRFEGLSGEEVQ